MTFPIWCFVIGCRWLGRFLSTPQFFPSGAAIPVRKHLIWWSDGNKGWRGAGGALAGWVLLKLSCQDVTWDPSALCHQLRQALAPWEVQKSRSFRGSHQVLLSCGGIVSEQGLGMAWGAHTVHTGSEVGSGAALELPHLTEIKVLNLQLMVMVNKMWLFPWEELVQPSPCCCLESEMKMLHFGGEKPQAPKLSLCVTKGCQVQLQLLWEVDGLCADKRISWSALWRDRGNENQFNLCHYFAFQVGRCWAHPGIFPGLSTWISVGKHLWESIFQTGASSLCTH